MSYPPLLAEKAVRVDGWLAAGLYELSDRCIGKLISDPIQTPVVRELMKNGTVLIDLAQQTSALTRRAVQNHCLPRGGHSDGH